VGEKTLIMLMSLARNFVACQSPLKVARHYNMTDFADLVDGYRRFRASGWQRQRERWAALAESQSPKVMVIACSDSRVDPATIFDASPGEMFIVRNVANLVPPFEIDNGRHGVSAALEFAVTQLNVPEIVVMGHGGCGGCMAALTQSFKHAQPGAGGFISRWIEMLDDARTDVIADHGHEFGAAASQAMEHRAIMVSLANLRSFPWIREREIEGKISLHGAYFALENGLLHVLDEGLGTFSPV
jgi:carbonic anhydrase